MLLLLAVAGGLMLNRQTGDGRVDRVHLLAIAVTHYETTRVTCPIVPTHMEAMVLEAGLPVTPERALQLKHSQGEILSKKAAVQSLGVSLWVTEGILRVSFV